MDESPFAAPQSDGGAWLEASTPSVGDREQEVNGTEAWSEYDFKNGVTDGLR